VKNKELQDITIILSKRDKEITTLKNELEDAKEDATKMRKYAKTLETESSNKKENVETILGRVKDLTCSTLKL
jgi:FtsZ-binding cell division protein ZapB